MLERVQSLVAGDADLAGRLLRLRAFGRRIRVAEYHLTNACNLRCQGCWFFAYDFDAKTREANAPASWRAFASEQAARGTAETLGLGMMGVGGFAAIAGGIMFLAVAGAAWIHRVRVGPASEALAASRRLEYGAEGPG